MKSQKSSKLISSKSHGLRLARYFIIPVLAFSLFVVTVDFAFSDTVWNDTSSSLYSASKAFKVGDIITIIILETTNAVQKADTGTDVTDSLSTAFSSNIASFLHPGKAISGSGGNTYSGQGSTTRQSNVTAKVAAVVTRVLSNGNLLVSGEHRVEVNEEVQTIKISGMVRPKDVSVANTVYSYQVAGASVSIKGRGSVGEAEEPGFFTRYLQLAILMKVTINNIMTSRLRSARYIVAPLLAISFLVITCCFAFAASPVRVKDIAHVLEARDNQLIGYGLVGGLKNTGDSIQTEYTKQALANLLSRMGIVPQDKEFRSRNVASVIVTAKLPPFVSSGQKIDVTVSSLGDATSLLGGTLMMTPLQGPDDNVYAVAQGQLSFGVNTSDSSNGSYDQRQTNVGRIPGGALVEKEVPVSMPEDYVTIVLDKPDFTTASRLVAAIKSAGFVARARDAGTIFATKEASMEMVDFISRVENLTIIPDTVAKIIINETTGVIVMGDNVKVTPVAVSYNDVNVVISSESTVSSLVSSLNTLGIKPVDLLAILNAVKSAGAISADIEVI